MGRVSSFVVRFPVCLAILFALPSVLCTIILIVRQGNKSTAISIDTSWGQFKVEGDPSTTRVQMFEAAQTMSFKKMVVGQAAEFPLQSKGGSRSLMQYSYRQWFGKGLTLIYVSEGNILNRESIAKIHDVEARIKNSPGFKDYCQLYQGTSNCVAPSTIINFLYPSRDGDTFVFDGKGSEMVADLPLSIKALLAANRAGFTDRDTSASNPSSKTLISQFGFGFPLEGFSGPNDRWSEQVMKLRKFINGLEPMLASMDEDENLGFRLLRFGGDIVEEQIDAYLLEDVLTAIASFTFVFLLMWIYTRSLSLTTLGVLGMIMSFPPCTLICIGFFGTQFNVLSLVSFWVIAGIGADDVFIFVDMWKQTRYMEEEGADPATVLERRMTHAFKEAKSAMFVTSFTTAAAFFATGTSAVLPLRVFGIYLGLLVLYNYLLVITWFPVCMLLYEKAYRKYACCRKSIFCCRKRARVGIGEPIPIADNEEVPNPEQKEENPEGMRIHRSPSPLDPCIEKYFKCLYKTRYCILIGFVLFVGGLATQIPRLGPANDLPRLLPLDSNIEMLRLAKKTLQCSDCEYGAAKSNYETSQPLRCPVSTCGQAVFPTARTAPTSPTMVPGTRTPTITRAPVTRAPTDPPTPPTPRPTRDPTWAPITPPPTQVMPTARAPSALSPAPMPPTMPPTLFSPTMPPTLFPPTRPPSMTSPTMLAPTMPPSPPTAGPPTMSTPTPRPSSGALISWDLFGDSNCLVPFTEVQNHSVRDVPNGACVDLHPGPTVAVYFPQLSGRATCGEPGYADSSNTVELFASSDCSGSALVTKQGAGDGCQLGQAPVNSGRITCGTLRRSPTAPVLTAAPSALPPTSIQSPTAAPPPTAASPTASPPTVPPTTASPPTAASPISWDLFSDANCAIPFTAVDNHSAHDIPNGACVDLHPGPLVVGVLPNASARVVCEDPGYADSPNRMYLYPNADCSGTAAITKEGAGNGCQLGQAPVNSGRVICGTATRPPTPPTSPPLTPTSPPTTLVPTPPTTPPACSDDPQNYLFTQTGQSCQAVVEYIRDCNLDLNQFDPQIPPRTYAKDLCPLSCNTCPPPTAAPSPPPTPAAAPTDMPVCSDDANGWLQAMDYSCDELLSVVGGDCRILLANVSRRPFPAGTRVGDLCPVKCGWCTVAPTNFPTTAAPTTSTPTPPSPRPAAPTPFPLTVQESLTIHFLWGVADVNMETANLDTPGTPIFAGGFLEDDEGIIALADIMTALSEDPDARNPYFPLLAYKATLGAGQWPMPARQFAKAFRAWIASGGSSYNADVGFLEDPHRVSWIHGRVSTYVSKDTEGSKLEPVYLKWEEKMAQLNARTQSSANQGFPFADQFVRMKVELAFITGLARSLAISSALIALTIICFTRNLLIMLLTLAVILAVVISLLGFYVIWGWTFGAVEALATSLVSGLSVDYALHMGHSYNQVRGANGEKVGRTERTRQALLGIGPSILAASATTIFSMLVLLSCSTYLFVEIGIIVSTTLLLGVVFSLGVFNAALLCIGPEGDCGNVVVMVKRCGVFRGLVRRLRGDRADMSAASIELQ